VEELLELQPGDTRQILRHLCSLVDIDMCSDDIDSDSEYNTTDSEYNIDDSEYDTDDLEYNTDDTLNTSIFHHASFLDFLQDSMRSKHFFIDQPQHKTCLAHYMLKAFSSDEVHIWMCHPRNSESRTYAE
jgi:hypothetical protein